MNFEDMITRCSSGLAILRSIAPSAALGAHSNMLFVPDIKESDLSSTQIENMRDLGWAFDPDFGALFPTIG